MSSAMDKEFVFDVHEVRDLKDMMRITVRDNGPGNAFLSKEDGVYTGITYNELHRDMEGLGTALLEAGYKDAFIGVMGENSYAWCLTYLAVVNGTGVIVPLDKELDAAEMLYLAEQSGMQVLVYSSKQKEKAEYLKEKSSTISLFLSMEEELPAFMEKGKNAVESGNRMYLDMGIDPEKLSILLYTSGTTGMAKGVMLCHRNILTELYGICKIVDLDRKDTLLSILPIHHTYECTCGFLATMYKGGTLAFCEGIRYIAQNIKEVRPTKIVLVPLILEGIFEKIKKKAEATTVKKILFRLMVSAGSLLKNETRKKLFHKVHDVFGGRLEQVICGASALNPKVSKALENMGLQILQGYGLTECAPIATGNRQFANKHGSIGLPLPGVEVAIHKPDEKGIGEIIIRGGNVMIGYYNNPEATASTLRNGWLHTGDVGYVDKDGFFYITGRIKNLIVTKTGKNIFPEELEAKLNESPFILESLVSGSEEDITKEDTVKAHIVPRMEAIKEKLNAIKPSLEEIRRVIEEEVQRINRKLPIFKRIQKIHVQDEEFEKTTTKKIKRHKLRKEN
ncbi:MAG: AMP-binding protein [Clostridia bacterium]